MSTAIVVGAGIGGLAAAVALRRSGWDVRVVEQAAEPRELGFALALAPNALAALDELGLKDAVVSRGVEITSFEARRADGSVLKRLDLRKGAVQSVVVLRPALHGTLLEAAGPDVLQLGTSITESAVRDRCATPPGIGAAHRDLPPLDSDVVIGADGVASTVRRALHPDEPPPRLSGYHALRGVSLDVGRELGAAAGAVYFGDGVEIGVMRASANAVYWYVSMLSADAYADPQATLERATRGLDPRARAIISAAKRQDMRADPLFYRAPLDDWGRGSITLLGDAAHPVLPHTAQGAALALEDAVALSLALKGADVEQGLRLYERVRAPRTGRIVRAGPRIAAMTTTHSRVRIALREAAAWITPARALSLALARKAPDPHRPLRR